MVISREKWGKTSDSTSGTTRSRCDVDVRRPFDQTFGYFRKNVVRGIASARNEITRSRGIESTEERANARI